MMGSYLLLLLLAVAFGALAIASKILGLQDLFYTFMIIANVYLAAFVVKE